MTSAIYAIAAQMWRDGRSCKAIADAIGVPEDRVRRLVRYHREDFPPRYGKATPESVERMHELRGEGMTYEQIAAAVGVSESTVQRHMREETR